MMAPAIRLESSRARRKRESSKTAYSSGMRRRTVSSRQCETSASRLKTPATILVFPTSMASSIRPSPLGAIMV
jgi:hypothetical protein